MSNPDINNLQSCAGGIDSGECTVNISSSSIALSQLKAKFGNIIANINSILTTGPTKQSSTIVTTVMTSLLYYGGATSFSFSSDNNYTLINETNANNLFTRWNSRNTVNINNTEIMPLDEVFNLFEASKPFLSPNNEVIPYYQAFNPYLYYIIYEFFYNSTTYKLNGNSEDILLQNMNNIGTPIKFLLAVLNSANGAGGLLIKNICLNSYFNKTTFLNEKVNTDSSQWPLGIRRLLLNNYLGYWCGSSLPMPGEDNKFLIKNKNQPNPAVGTGPNFEVQCEAFSNYDGGLGVWNSYSYYVNNNVSATSGQLFPEKKDCPRAICIMNGVAVNGSGNTGQSFSFSQQCSGCAQNKNEACFCYIMDSDSLRKLNLGNPVKFKQSCPNAECYKVESDGEIIPQDCTTQPSNSGKPDPESLIDGGGDTKTIGETFEYGIDIWYFPIYLFSFTVIIIFLLWIMENRAHRIFKRAKTNTEGESLIDKVKRFHKETKEKIKGNTKFKPLTKLSKLFHFI